MNELNKYKKRILKQYGKNIKAHEMRMDKQHLTELQISHFVKRGCNWYENYNSLILGVL